MKLNPLIRKVIFSSWFLAAIPAALMMLSLPYPGHKYSLSLIPAGRFPGQSIYADINSDSTSEFLLQDKGIPYYFILVMGNQNKIYDQWNLQDEIDLSLSPFFTGNYDHDACSEIYVFTHKGDSLFLNINEFFEAGGTKQERVFISKISYLKGELTSNVYVIGYYDANLDGKDELYFDISTGFGVVPRKIFYYDIAERKLHSGETVGNMIKKPVFEDADGDGKPEIFGELCGSGNQKANVPYTDWSTWLMVFNEKLQFKFEPVEFPGYPATLETCAYKNSRFSGYLVARYQSSADTTLRKSSVMLFTGQGKLVREKPFSSLGLNACTQPIVTGSGNSARIFLIGDRIVEIDENFNVLSSSEPGLKDCRRIFKTDINNDGNDEYFLYGPEDEKVVLLSHDMKKLCSIIFRTQSEMWIFSKRFTGGKPDKTFLWAGGQGFDVLFDVNRLYFLGYLYYPGIYLAFFLLIFLTKKITTYQFTQRENLKQRLIDLQLQGIRSQLDPHFIFNTLNSVASFIYLEDRQAAYDYMNKFSLLLRGVIKDAERIYRTLGEELGLVTAYLDLEKLRFNDKLTYHIEIGEGVTLKENVPKLVLQTFAENSIKHGIMPLSAGGQIKISAILEKDYLRLSVEDDGIGRARSAGRSNSTGRGLKLTNEFYDILNQMNKQQVRFQITDLADDSGAPCGTRVDVWVPADLK